MNILFEGSRPVFVDLLSIERRDPGSPLWLAYGQFARTFLLPLAAYKYLGWPLAATLHRRDGYEPVDLYPYLSVSSVGALRCVRWLRFLTSSKAANAERERRLNCSRSRKSLPRFCSETLEASLKHCMLCSQRDAIRAGANTSPPPITTANGTGSASRNLSSGPCNYCVPARYSISAATLANTRALLPARVRASSPGTPTLPHRIATGKRPGGWSAHPAPGR